MIRPALTLLFLLAYPIAAQQPTERELNALGYRLIGEHKVSEAIAVFKQVIERFPASANAYDSYGDGLAAAGRRVEAAAAFEEAYRRDTTNRRARDLAARLRDPVRAAKWTNILADPAVKMDTVEIASGGDVMRAYIARPAKPGQYPAVVVIHANRITEPYIASTTQMLGRAGFAAIAVDVFHFLPGNASWESASSVTGDTVNAVVAREFREPRLLRNLQSGIDYMRKQSYVARGGVALMGFCGGGWNALIASAQLRDVGAVVAFHAPVNLTDIQHRSPMELAAYIKVPVQLHRASKDRFVDNPAITTFAATLRAQGTPLELFDYDAGHGFFAWNRDGAFVEREAEAAWARVVPFLEANAGKPLQARQLAPARVASGASGAQRVILHDAGAHTSH
jgi:carboxymethylenebutenolidase